MTDLVDHYATLATLEAAAMGEHPAAAALVALVTQQRAALDELELARPSRPSPHRPASPGALLRWLVPDARDHGAAWDAQQAAYEAWRAERDDVEPRTSGELAAWRATLDPAWLAALEVDREAALRGLVSRDLYPSHLVAFTLDGGFGDWHRLAALADD
ncbi:hypothetical protein [Agrococcus jejuensis]|nr:hypothetical protein [Agrococcus jejuensis]